MHEISNLFPFNYRQALFSFDLFVKDGGGMPVSIVRSLLYVTAIVTPGLMYRFIVALARLGLAI